MKLLKSIIGGFAGAIALNLIHETARRIDPDAPRVDLIGEEGLVKSAKVLGLNPPKAENLYLATLAADVISNGLYFSAIGMGSKKNLILKGLISGWVAGVGAVNLPDKLGLNDQPVNKSEKTRNLTIAWYVIGGLVTAVTIKKLLK